MPYLILVLLGAAAGAVCTYLLLEGRLALIFLQRRRNQKQAARVREAAQALESRERECLRSLEARREEVEKQAATWRAEHDAYRFTTLQEIAAKRAEVDKQVAYLQAQRAELLGRAVSNRELEDENRILKRDLLNLTLNIRKLELDRDGLLQAASQHQQPAVLR